MHVKLSTIRAMTAPEIEQQARVCGQAADATHCRTAESAREHEYYLRMWALWCHAMAWKRAR